MTMFQQNEDEQLKLCEARRKRMEETTKRLLNSKQRSIGIDKEVLDLQVLEKKQRELQEQREAEIESKHMKDTLEYLEEQERIKESIRLERMEEYKKTLEFQLKEPKSNAIAKGDPIDLETCGSSSLQRFMGEDINYEDRLKAQQKQLNRWCLKSLKEKEIMAELEKNREIEYSNQVQEEDRIRERLQIEREDQLAKLEVTIKEENDKIAEDKQKRLEELLIKEKELEQMESSYVSTSPFYTEIITSEKRVPCDFKGFDKEKVSAIIRGNEDLLKEKIKITDEEIKREHEWMSNQNYTITQIEQMELERKKAIKDDNQIQLEILNSQRKEFEQRKRDMQKDRFGEISYGFFQKFGTTLT